MAGSKGAGRRRLASIGRRARGGMRVAVALGRDSTHEDKHIRTAEEPAVTSDVCVLSGARTMVVLVVP